MARTKTPSVQKVQPLSRRLRERAAGSFFRASTRMVGLRPELIPMHMRQQMHVIGVTEEQLERVLRTIRALSDWPYAWEAEGDRHAADRDWQGAGIAYYLAQRPLITQSALKRRLYSLTIDAYERADYGVPLERLEVTSSLGELVSGYLQLKERPTGSPAPLVIMVPGVTSTKEELHVFALPLVRRGFAVARIDNPYYGQTTGSLVDGAQFNPAAVVEHLSRDPRIDAQRIHLFGMSMGAHFALNAATRCQLASAYVIAPAFDATSFLERIPTSNQTAISVMMGTDDWGEIMALAGRFGLGGGRASQITAPVRIVHGARDRTIPLSESEQLARELGGPAALHIFERAHHNCLEHFDELVVDLLEWLHDPAPALAAYTDKQRAARVADGRAQSTTHESLAPDDGHLEPYTA